MKKFAILPFAAVVLVVGCRRPPPRPEAPAPRIVSFTPAITDLLYDMGLGAHVVGVTTHCMPSDNNPPPAVGNRSRVSAEAILAVKPDVILIYQNPQDFGAITAIDPHVRIVHLPTQTLEDIAAAIDRIGQITAQPQRAAAKKQAFWSKLETIEASVASLPRPRVLFLLGYDRPSTGGTGTFIDEMIQRSGGLNAAAQRGYTGWKTLNRENILAMEPDVLLCQVDPGQEQDARAHWQSFVGLPAVKQGRVFVVSDRRWTIPSMRSADYTARLAETIHPQIGELSADE